MTTGGRGGRANATREKMRWREKKEEKERGKRVAKEVKAVAENVAEKRGWTKESAARKVGENGRRLELSRRLEGGGRRYPLV